MDQRAREKIEAWIRQGNFAAARAEIHSLATGHCTREDRLKLAEFARRAGIPHLGVKLLNPIVRPKERRPVEPTAEERIEYAANLIRIGAPTEALALLQSAGAKEHPSSHLFVAFAHMHQWEYESAVPPLLAFLHDSRTTEYQRTVAEVNLAAAYVHNGEHDPAERLLAKLRKETRDAGNLLLLGNTLEISAQNAVMASRYDEASDLLEQSEALLLGQHKTADSADALYIRKWRAVAKVRQDPNSYGALQEVMNEARALNEWETLRDCDFHRAVALGDRELLLKLYFGTPYASYRKQLLPYLKDLPQTYLHGKGAKTLDLESGAMGKRSLAYNQVPHRLLKILASDLYRPQRLVAVHARLFPDRFYNPRSSPAVVHQAVKRLREWLKRESIPLTIRESSSAYQLELSPRLSLRFAAQWPSKSERSFATLESRFGQEPFSATDAAGCLGISRRSAINLLNEALAAGKVTREGSGPQTKYRG